MGIEGGEETAGSAFEPEIVPLAADSSESDALQRAIDAGHPSTFHLRPELEIVAEGVDELLTDE